MDDAKRSENVHVNSRIPRPSRGRVPPYLVSAPVTRRAGSKRRLQEPACPINAKDPKIVEKINDWLSGLRRKVDEEQKTSSSGEMSPTHSEGSQVYADRVSCLDQQNDKYKRRIKSHSKSKNARRRQQNNVYQNTECSSPNTTNSPAIGSYSQPSLGYNDQYVDKNDQGYNFNDQGTSLFVFSASYQNPNSACNESQGSNTTELNKERDTPEPIDLVASKTYMYVLSDHEESSPKKRKKRSKKKKRKEECCHRNKKGNNKHSSEEKKSGVFYSEPNSQPETGAEIAEPLCPVATKTYMSVFSDHEKIRKRRRKRSNKKRKAIRSLGRQEVTSQDNDLARAARERLRLAEINVLCYRLGELTLDSCQPDRTTGVKRKHEPVPRGDMPRCDVDSLDVKIRKLSIG
ncbi:uncharacterized protein LOC110454252 [Mizuhopecten yessoensis]|uniref:Uncharacterized protein n=1 Tax=Mizuhopecten yessoensis TaxID=6573 RepID=A0A210QFJ9_MIZYE|nr:uncharacterized protein LOC110454252 [Mizuhopecten yessoensis]OWF47524.1 hypothetical protein KP79_PYT15586 [Mizuhopecten yessoensis]